ncbi:hypothetical protein C8F01DRAFT_337902 [Mycena amicta]|nr:hypothetical protein C8F01DRAFT_337902 [Mycena amicta]
MAGFWQLQKAAHAFLKLGAANASRRHRHLRCPCARSSLPLTSVGAQGPDSRNSTFGVYIEVGEAYLSRRCWTCSTATRRPIHWTCTSRLTIRNWAVGLYFQPFSSIHLDRMSAAFGWLPVVNWIQAGSIHGRVHSQDGILYAKHRLLFARAIKAGRGIRATNGKVLLRMRLQQAYLMIKALVDSQPRRLECSALHS